MNINELLKEKIYQNINQPKRGVPQTTIIDICSNKQKNQKRILTNVTHPSHWTKIHSINSNQAKNHYVFPSDMAQFYLKSNVRDAIR